MYLLVLLALAFFALLVGCSKNEKTLPAFADSDKAEIPIAIEPEKSCSRLTDYMFFDYKLGSLTIDKYFFESSQITETDKYYDHEYEFRFTVDDIEKFGLGQIPIVDWYLQGFSVVKDGQVLLLTAKEKRITAFERSEDNDFIYIKPVHPRKIYKKIAVIDAGHGGEDSGAWSVPDVVSFNNKNRVIEKDYNLDLALKVAELFSDDDQIKVYLTRSTDTFLTLSERREIRDYTADVFVSIHLNSSESKKSTGSMTYFYGMLEPVEYSSKMFADDMIRTIQAQTKLEGGFIEYANYAVLRDSLVPATLVEVAFLTNENDLNRLVDKNFSDEVSRGIYNGIKEGLSKTKIIES